MKIAKSVHRTLLLFFILVPIFSCEKLLEVKQYQGPCIIELVGGKEIITPFTIEILESTKTITYRDDKGKLWSIKADEYVNYSCGN